MFYSPLDDLRSILIIIIIMIMVRDLVMVRYTYTLNDFGRHSQSRVTRVGAGCTRIVVLTQFRATQCIDINMQVYVKCTINIAFLLCNIMWRFRYYIIIIAFKRAYYYRKVINIILLCIYARMGETNSIRSRYI